VRVLSYNIQGGVRGVPWIAGVVRDLAADVACLNEVRRGQHSRIASVAGRRALWGPARRLGNFGNTILVREKPRSVRVVRLSKTVGLERRAMIVARFGTITVATTHLGLVGEERLRHAGEILDALPSGGPVILAGDLNEAPDGPAMSMLLTRFTDAFALAGDGPGFTFPASAPAHRIDYVLASRHVIVEACRVEDVRAADHRPVVAELAV
jgi:endonuclease/exonuclease/phosphatase family metal-dependent hydrolase